MERSSPILLEYFRVTFADGSKAKVTLSCSPTK